MTSKKRTRRALLNSVISLFICFSMLLGTTFAWFTDSVTSANNIIKAGNLDVELYWSTNFTDWEKVDETTNVFKEDALWAIERFEKTKIAKISRAIVFD